MKWTIWNVVLAILNGVCGHIQHRELSMFVCGMCAVLAVQGAFDWYGGREP